MCHPFADLPFSTRSTKSEAKIEQNKQQMQKHGEKVMRLQSDMQAKAKQAADEVIAQQAQLEEPDS